MTIINFSYILHQARVISHKYKLVHNNHNIMVRNFIIPASLARSVLQLTRLHRLTIYRVCHLTNSLQLKYGHKTVMQSSILRYTTNSSKMSTSSSKISNSPLPIVVFFAGGKDDEGRTLDEMLSWSDLKLERLHDYIQWMFPLPENRYLFSTMIYQFLYIVCYLMCPILVCP